MAANADAGAFGAILADIAVDHAEQRDDRCLARGEAAIADGQS